MFAFCPDVFRPWQPVRGPLGYRLGVLNAPHMLSRPTLTRGVFVALMRVALVALADGMARAQIK